VTTLGACALLRYFGDEPPASPDHSSILRISEVACEFESIALRHRVPITDDTSLELPKRPAPVASSASLWSQRNLHNSWPVSEFGATV
jgi:hypothetical protein